MYRIGWLGGEKVFEQNRVVSWEKTKKTLPRAALLLGGILLGVVLLLIGNTQSVPSSTEMAEEDSLSDLAAYTADLEEKIRQFCRRVEGVGEVSVTVSLESGYRRVYDKTDSVYVFSGSNSLRGAVCLNEEPPTIGGIAIVCEGGGDPAVRERLVGLLRAAYGIGANKIYIAPAQN